MTRSKATRKYFQNCGIFEILKKRQKESVENVKKYITIIKAARYSFYRSIIQVAFLN